MTSYTSVRRGQTNNKIPCAISSTIKSIFSKKKKYFYVYPLSKLQSVPKMKFVQLHELDKNNFINTNFKSHILFLRLTNLVKINLKL